MENTDLEQSLRSTDVLIDCTGVSVSSALAMASGGRIVFQPPFPGLAAAEPHLFLSNPSHPGGPVQRTRGSQTGLAN